MLSLVFQLRRPVRLTIRHQYDGPNPEVLRVRRQVYESCGCHIGIANPPSWVEEPMIYEGNPLVLEPGMVLFTHMIMQDDGCEPLTRVPRELVIN